MPSSLGHTSEGGDEEEKMECEGEEEEGEGGEDTHPPNLMSHLHIMLTTGAAGHVSAAEWMSHGLSYCSRCLFHC